MRQEIPPPNNDQVLALRPSIPQLTTEVLMRAQWQCGNTRSCPGPAVSRSKQSAAAATKRAKASLIAGIGAASKAAAASDSSSSPAAAPAPIVPEAAKPEVPQRASTVNSWRDYRSRCQL
jgi:hypothetical protein